MNAERFKLPFGSKVFEPDSEFVRLVYNRPSSCLVAQFVRLMDSQIPVQDLYYRESSSSNYTKAPKDDRTRSYCEPVSCKGKPYVFFNVFQWDKSGVGSDWMSISRLALPDGAVAHLIDKNSLKLPRGCIRGWVSSLLDVNDDGTILTCKVALEFATEPNGSWVEYSVRDLNLATGEHKALVTLPAVFV